MTGEEERERLVERLVEHYYTRRRKERLTDSLNCITPWGGGGGGEGERERGGGDITPCPAPMVTQVGTLSHF